jgi:hypothetical protein
MRQCVIYLHLVLKAKHAIVNNAYSAVHRVWQPKLRLEAYDSHSSHVRLIMSECGAVRALLRNSHPSLSSQPLQYVKLL